LISQIGIHYRGSPESTQRREHFRSKLAIECPTLVEGQSIYDKLHQPKFHGFLSNPLSDVQALKTELDHSDLEFVDFNVIPLDPQVAEVFGMNQVFNILLRPDNYIAFISRSLCWVKHYLKQLTTQ